MAVVQFYFVVKDNQVLKVFFSTCIPHLDFVHLMMIWLNLQGSEEAGVLQVQCHENDKIT